MLQSPEVQARIAELRVRADAGVITDDEYREVIALLRAGRQSAAVTASRKTTSRAKAKAAIPDAQDMLNELEGL